MVLHAEYVPGFVPEAFDGLIVQIDPVHHNVRAMSTV
jgi:hypothetical protein